MEGTLAWVMAGLGVVAFLVIEGIKFYQKAAGKLLSGRAKLWVSLITCVVMALVGGLATGELDFGFLVEGFQNLPEDPMGAVVGVFDLIMQAMKLIGLLFAVASAMYAALKEKLKEKQLLSFAL